MTSDALFSAETYANVRKPLLEAATLPPECYTSKAFYEREIERVFLRNWQFVGREEQVAEPGQFFCYDGLGGPIIVLRSLEGEIKAFANSCRHRGARLLHGNGRCKRIVCPYHSWTYRLDGSLAATPGMQGPLHFKPGDYPLLELRLEIWAGFVFIHYRDDPVAFSEHIGNMPQHFDGHRCADMRQVGRLDFEINSNWKLPVENALEAYHTGSVHRDTLGAQVSRAIESSGNWTGLLVEDEHSVATLPGEGDPFPHIEGLGSQARTGAYFTMLYPSTQFVFAQDCIWWLAFKPEAIDRSSLSIGACFPRSTIDLPGFEDRVKPYFDRWRRATAEDNAICEQQQQGQQCARPPGRFSASEFAVHDFANWIVDQVLEQ